MTCTLRDSVGAVLRSSWFWVGLSRQHRRRRHTSSCLAAISSISLEPGHDTQTLRTGWYVDLAGNLTRVFAIVGQVGGNYRSRDVLGNDLRFSMHEFMGGIRASGTANTRFVPFGQVLAGPVRANLSLMGEGVSVTKFALQFGGGVNWRLTQRIGIRMGADYLRIFNGQEGRDIGDLSGGDRGDTPCDLSRGLYCHWPSSKSRLLPQRRCASRSALSGFDHEHGNRHVVADAVRGAAAEHVVDKSMAVSRHRDQIDVLRSRAA